MPSLDLISITRVCQILFSLIALGLNASVIHWFNTHERVGGPPGYLILLVFSSVFTILISAPYTTFAPKYFPAYINRYASLAVELTTTVFWFAGFIAGAVWLGTIDICAGFICSNARAGVAFAAFMFLCYCITSYFPIKYCFFDSASAPAEEKWRGTGGAELISKARTRRDANNNARIQAEREGEPTGILPKLKRNFAETVEVFKIRGGNAMAEWRTKSERNGRVEHREAGQEMDDRGGVGMV